MADLKIPNLTRKSDKYLFKKKLSLRRKSKKKLLSESFIMFFLSILFAFLGYLVPNKNYLFNNFLVFFEKSFFVMIELLSYLYQIFLVIFSIVSLIIAIFMLLGSFYRIIKVIKRKTKLVSYD